MVGKLLREKTFTYELFQGLWLFVKVFSTKFEGVASFCDTSEPSMKVFSCKSFLLYGIGGQGMSLNLKVIV